MPRPRELIFPRVIARIDHPRASEIPLLALDKPEHWPRDFLTPWMASVAGISVEGRYTLISHLLYELLIGPIPPDHQLRARFDPLDVNPLHRHLVPITREVLPPASAPNDPVPLYAHEFDVDDVAALLDELNPRSVSQILHLLDDYYPTQIFEALQRANLHTRLGLKSALEITR